MIDFTVTFKPGRGKRLLEQSDPEDYHIDAISPKMLVAMNIIEVSEQIPDSESKRIAYDTQSGPTPACDEERKLAAVR